jgi:hypothetical protein
MQERVFCIQNLRYVAKSRLFCVALCERHHPGHQVQALQASQQGQRSPSYEREFSQAH